MYGSFHRNLKFSTQPIVCRECQAAVLAVFVTGGDKWCQGEFKVLHGKPMVEGGATGHYAIEKRLQTLRRMLCCPLRLMTHAGRIYEVIGEKIMQRGFGIGHAFVAKTKYSGVFFKGKDESPEEAFWWFMLTRYTAEDCFVGAEARQITSKKAWKKEIWSKGIDWEKGKTIWLIEVTVYDMYVAELRWDIDVVADNDIISTNAEFEVG